MIFLCRTAGLYHTHRRHHGELGPAGGKHICKDFACRIPSRLSKGAVFEFSFHAIHTIELKFTIDKHTASMVALRVLSRTNLAWVLSLEFPHFLYLLCFLPLAHSFSLFALFFRRPSFISNNLRTLF